jgi:hypothetical protein
MCCAAAWLLLLYLLLPAALLNPQPCCTLPADAAEASSDCCPALLLLLQLLPACMEPSALVLVLVLLRGLADALCCLLGVARAGATAAAACGPFRLSLLAMVPLCTDAQQQLHTVRPPHAPSLQQTGLHELLMVLTLLLQANSSLLPLPGCGWKFINLRAGVGLAGAAGAAAFIGLLHGVQCLVYNAWCTMHVAAGPAAAAAVSAANLVDRPAAFK